MTKSIRLFSTGDITPYKPYRRNSRLLKNLNKNDDDNNQDKNIKNKNKNKDSDEDIEEEEEKEIMQNKKKRSEVHGRQSKEEQTLTGQRRKEEGIAEVRKEVGTRIEIVIKNGDQAIAGVEKMVEKETEIRIKGEVEEEVETKGEEVRVTVRETDMPEEVLYLGKEPRLNGRITTVTSSLIASRTHTPSSSSNSSSSSLPSSSSSSSSSSPPFSLTVALPGVSSLPSPDLSLQSGILYGAYGHNGRPEEKEIAFENDKGICVNNQDGKDLTVAVEASRQRLPVTVKTHLQQTSVVTGAGLHQNELLDIDIGRKCVGMRVMKGVTQACGIVKQEEKEDNKIEGEKKEVVNNTVSEGKVEDEDSLAQGDRSHDELIKENIVINKRRDKDKDGKDDKIMTSDMNSYDMSDDMIEMKNEQTDEKVDEEKERRGREREEEEQEVEKRKDDDKKKISSGSCMSEDQV